MLDLENGIILSYSSGVTSLDVNKFRIIKNDKSSNKISEILSDKELHRTPILINSYPTNIGFVPGAILVDTYMQSKIFLRSIELTNNNNYLPVIISYPLYAFQLLLDMQKNLKTYPSNITLLLGGYNCPFSLEVAFCNLAKELKININILYVYGIAEVESAIFLGRRNFETKDIMYKLISKDTSYLVKDFMLFLIYNKMEFETGDYAMELNNNLIIKQNSQRYSKEVSSFLESWSYEDWRKNTGYIYIENSIIYFQTRKNIETTSNLEIEYFNFLRTTNLTWLDKPNWK